MSKELDARLAALIERCDETDRLIVDTRRFADLESENAKLRGLVRDIYKLCWNGLDCTECPRSFYDRCDKSGGCSWLGILHVRMRELGVEVDG